MILNQVDLSITSVRIAKWPGLELNLGTDFFQLAFSVKIPSSVTFDENLLRSAKIPWTSQKNHDFF